MAEENVKIRVRLMSGDYESYDFPLKLTADQVKGEIFMKSVEKKYAKTNYFLTIGDDIIEVEFKRFVDSHDAIKEAYSKGEAIEIGIISKLDAKDLELKKKEAAAALGAADRKKVDTSFFK